MQSFENTTEVIASLSESERVLVVIHGKVLLYMKLKSVEGVNLQAHYDECAIIGARRLYGSHVKFKILSS